ncbi:MAG: hypothetical protein LBE31_10165, partial [Deltaproteobacteria bacterium]|nr:hypothetical protein [Deltaproteobacteria bacterium]
MASNILHLLGITTVEWLDWLATGWLLLNRSVVRVYGSDDKEGIFSLLAQAPNGSRFDAGDFLIAELNQNWRDSLEPVKESLGLISPRLRIDCVKRFIPFSDRGQRLLAIEAQQANVQLSQPEFEKLWIEWNAEQIGIQAHWQGKNLVRALNLDEPDFSLLPPEVNEYLLGLKALPNADKAVLLKATKALAWANAFAIFGIMTSDKEKQKQTDNLQLKDVINKLRKDYNFNDLAIYKSPYINILNQLSVITQSDYNIDLSYALIVVIYSYYNIIDCEKDIILENLLEDLCVLDENQDFKLASLAAYFIGRRMDRIQVTTLLYNSLFSILPFMENKTIEFNIDIKKEKDKYKKYIDGLIKSREKKPPEAESAEPVPAVPSVPKRKVDSELPKHVSEENGDSSPSSQDE